MHSIFTCDRVNDGSTHVIFILTRRQMILLCNDVQKETIKNEGRQIDRDEQRVQHGEAEAEI